MEKKERKKGGREPFLNSNTGYFSYPSKFEILKFIVTFSKLFSL